MPFQSLAQERFMYSQHPDLAKKFQAETPQKLQSKLPEYASGQKTQSAEEVRNGEATPDRKIEAMKALIKQAHAQAQPAGQMNYGLTQ